MLMANRQTAELTEPCVGAFDDPAAFVSPQLAPILIAPVLVVAPVGHDQLDAPLLQPLVQHRQRGVAFTPTPATWCWTSSPAVEPQARLRPGMAAFCMVDESPEAIAVMEKRLHLKAERL